MTLTLPFCLLSYEKGVAGRCDICQTISPLFDGGLDLSDDGNPGQIMLKIFCLFFLFFHSSNRHLFFFLHYIYFS